MSDGPLNTEGVPKPRGIVETLKTRAQGKIAQTAFWLMVWKVVHLLNSLFVGIWIARHLGPTDYGAYAYVIALTLVLAPLKDLGINEIITRDIKLEGEHEGRLLGTAFGLRLLGTIVVTLAVIAIAYRSNIQAPGLVVLAGIVSGSSLMGSLRLLQFYFIAREATRPFVIGTVCVALAFSAIKISLILMGAGLAAFLITMGAETASGGLIAYAVYVATGGKWSQWRFDLGQAKSYLSRSIPLVAAGLTAAVYLKIDLLFLGEMISAEEAGTYGVAARLSEAWYVLPGVIASAVFPRLLEFRRDAAHRYRVALQKVLDLLTAAAMLGALAVTFAAGFVVDLLFGAEYAAAAPILMVHVWAGLFAFQRPVLDKWFVAEGLYRMSLVSYGAGAIVNVGLNLLLIPIWGGFGAAIATVISYGAATSGMLWFFRDGRSWAAMSTGALFWPLRVGTLIRSLKGGIT